MDIQLRQPYSFMQLGRRSNQEDARFPDEDAPQNCKPAFVVCDGVGGQDKGEIASGVIAHTVGKEMQGYDLSRPFTVREFEDVISGAYTELRQSMKEYGPEMATTMTFVCFHGAGVFVAHIGDSRIYHVRPGVGILYQSEDHSLVNALVHSGNLAPQEAGDHPQGNVITRCIGNVSANSQGPSVDTYQITDIEPGDYFFLCTDGVTHCLSDRQLLTLLSSSGPDRDKMEAISAICKGSPDNNTAYLIGINDIIYDEEDIDQEVDEMEVDTDDIDSGESGHNGQKTEPLRVPNEVIVAASLRKRGSFGDRISDFFNKIF